MTTPPPPPPQPSTTTATPPPPSPSLKSLGKRRASVDPSLLHPLASRRRHLTSLTTAQYSFNRSTPLKAHHSCVNALAVSSGPGRTFLASGGDDKRVLLWEAEGEMKKGKEPRGSYKGAQSNIFSIAWSCDSKRLFSGGNDNMVLMYDVETGTSTKSSGSKPPMDIWMQHDDSVHCVSTHPTNPNLLMSSSDDGTVLSYDLRTPTGVIGTLAEPAEMTSVVYHPTTPDLFVVGTFGGKLLLQDGRMAFVDGDEVGGGHFGGRTASEVAVRKFNTTLSQPLNARPTPSSTSESTSTSTTPITSFRTANPSISSLSFTPTGSLLSCIFSSHLPTLYELSSSEPLATFSAPGFSNCCTTKHGSFSGGGGGESGSGKTWFGMGSDDFRTYVWEVPSVERLREGKRRLGDGVEEWFDEDGEKRIAYESTINSDPILPTSISTPTSILTGHRSIVNTALFHPSLPFLYTCGIEKFIGVHYHSSSPTSSSTNETVFIPRQPAPSESNFSRMELMECGALSPEEQVRRENETEVEKELREREEDGDVLEYFDTLLKREGDGGLWDSESESSEEESDGEEGEGEGDAEAEGRQSRRALTQYVLDLVGSGSEEEEGQGQLEVDSDDSGVDSEEYP